jgi:serine/threonine protein kinase/protein involved in polysaccharide export with SLBB domain
MAGAAVPTDPGTGPRIIPPPIERVAEAFPNLEILELIGVGGMGVVFKARQPKLDRVAALKLLPESLSSDPTFAERFNREARSLARLNHPNIVTVYDFGQAGGFCYLLMEYVDGVNLRQAMRAGKFAASEALAIVPKICEALQYAHDEGILHRDIKPENILLDRKGRVKIADFGIAKLVGETKADITLTMSGSAPGTPHYMAPEQIETPAEVDHRADIYSLGVVFYEMLTGELPLGRFPAPSAKAEMDPRVDEVVFRTLEKERSQRFQNAGDVKTSVEQITSKTVTPPPPSIQPIPERAPSKVGFLSLVLGQFLAWPLLLMGFCFAAGGGRAPAALSFIATGTAALAGSVLGFLSWRRDRSTPTSDKQRFIGLCCAFLWPTILIHGLVVLFLQKAFFGSEGWPGLLVSTLAILWLDAWLIQNQLHRRRPELLKYLVGLTDAGFTAKQGRIVSVLWKGIGVFFVLLSLFIIAETNRTQESRNRASAPWENGPVLFPPQGTELGEPSPTTTSTLIAIPPDHLLRLDCSIRSNGVAIPLPPGELSGYLLTDALHSTAAEIQWRSLGLSGDPNALEWELTLRGNSPMPVVLRHFRGGRVGIYSAIVWLPKLGIPKRLDLASGAKTNLTLFTANSVDETPGHSGFPIAWEVDAEVSLIPRPSTLAPADKSEVSGVGTVSFPPTEKTVPPIQPNLAGVEKQGNPTPPSNEAIPQTKSTLGRVIVAGAVERPQYVQLQAERKLDLLEAISAAGGPTTNAQNGRIELRRASGEKVNQFGFQELLTQLNPSRRVYLESGDVVFVYPGDPIPEHQRGELEKMEASSTGATGKPSAPVPQNAGFVTVMGAVGRPQQIQVPTDHRMDLLEAIGAAGGLTREANLERIRLRKFKGGELSLFRYDALLAQGNPEQRIYLESGDVVIVDHRIL